MAARRGSGRFGIAAAAVAALLLGQQSAHAASFDCTVRALSASKQRICDDPELSKADESLARRVRGLLKRQGFGLYLGLRYWQARGAEEREACKGSRACIASSFRAQARTLDRLVGCLDNGIRKRACLRVTLSNEPATAHRPEQHRSEK